MLLHRTASNVNGKILPLSKKHSSGKRDVIVVTKNRRACAFANLNWPTTKEKDRWMIFQK
jgi:hypothetical protein